MECYNVVNRTNDDDPPKIHILKYQGSRAVEGSCLSNDKFLKPLRTKKVNIGSPKNMKFANIGDYWDDQTIGKITDLLHKFKDLFPTKFSKMKGIIGDLGEMKIPLKPDTKSVKQRPYRLNLRYKEKVKIDLDRMLDACIIEPVKELEWISPMVS